MKKLNISPKTRKTLRITGIVVLVAALIIVGFVTDLPSKIRYLLPGSDDYYIRINTNILPEEAPDAQITVTPVTGFIRKPITAEYWAEESCFHAVVKNRGIYRIDASHPEGSHRSWFVEVDSDDIYVMTYRISVLITPEGMDIPNTALKFNGHSYAVFKSTAGWEMIQQLLAEKGGYLAVLNSQEENEAVYAYCAENGCTTAFFGLEDPEGTNEWRWVNGEPLDYTNWHAGEPSDAHERYAQFFYNFGGPTWNDGQDPDQQIATYYICEWDGCNQWR